jgi:uncharacterized membrane protein
MSAYTTAAGRAPGELLRKLESRGVNVGNAERIVSAVTGATLIAFGLRKRGGSGTALALLGGGLLYRGASGHCDVLAALGMSTAGEAPGVQLRETITINAPADELYRFWRPLENLPLFMEHLVSVKRTGPLESHWVAQAPAGKTIEWDARITAEEDGRFLAWESLPGSDVTHKGAVDFRMAPGGRGTVVQVSMSYKPFAGNLGAAVATLFGKGAEQQIRGDLRRFKQIVEAGEIATVQGQPSGRDAMETGARDERQPARDALAVSAEIQAPAFQGTGPVTAASPAGTTESWDRELVGVVP